MSKLSIILLAAGIILATLSVLILLNIDDDLWCDSREFLDLIKQKQPVQLRMNETSHIMEFQQMILHIVFVVVRQEIEGNLTIPLVVQSIVIC